MCYFITVAVPVTEVERLRQAVPREMHLSSSNNPSVVQWLGSDARTFLVTTGNCSCDLYHAAGAREDAAVEAALRRKYSRKGWSDAGIQRALAQARGARQRRLAFTGLRSDLLALLCELADRGVGLSLLVHWYNGDPEKEAVAIRGRMVARCHGSMPPVEPDWLLEFTP